MPYIWAVLAVAALVAIALGIRAEGRWFAAHSKRGPWLTLRICTIPIAITTAGLVLMVSRSVRGPEALFAFYAMLLIGGPLFYFGMHWLAALWSRPRLALGEIAWIGFSGLLVVIGPVALASAAHPWVFRLARTLG